MGFFKKLIKHAKKDIKRDVGITKKVAMRPISDAKKAIGVGNRLSRKVGGPTLPTSGRLSRLPSYKQAMLGHLDGDDRRKGPARTAPSVSAKAPTPRRANVTRPAGGGVVPPRSPMTNGMGRKRFPR